jgi:hypothetical protein
MGDTLSLGPVSSNLDFSLTASSFFKGADPLLVLFSLGATGGASTGWLELHGFFSVNLMYEYQPDPMNDTINPLTDATVATNPPNTIQPATTQVHQAQRSTGQVERVRESHLERFLRYP